MLGFIGGTGPEGRGLALRFAAAGEDVLLGSRDAARAAAVAETLGHAQGGGRVVGLTNAEAARRADTVFVTVPYSAQRESLAVLAEELTGKTVVSVVAPLTFIKGQARAVPVEEGSAAAQAQALLPRSNVVGAFQNLSARDLLDADRPVECDVVVCADDDVAKALVMALAEKIDGVRAVDGGALENARYVEELTALLLNINRVYRAHSTIRIVGI